jgi:hypothetical protein
MSNNVATLAAIFLLAFPVWGQQAKPPKPVPTVKQEKPQDSRELLGPDTTTPIYLTGSPWPEPEGTYEESPPKDGKIIRTLTLKQDWVCVVTTDQKEQPRAVVLSCAKLVSATGEK